MGEHIWGRENRHEGKNANARTSARVGRSCTAFSKLSIATAWDLSMGRRVMLAARSHNRKIARRGNFGHVIITLTKSLRARNVSRTTSWKPSSDRNAEVWKGQVKGARQPTTRWRGPPEYFSTRWGPVSFLRHLFDFLSRNVLRDIPASRLESVPCSPYNPRATTLANGS
jgi:hypothetical protein